MDLTNHIGMELAPAFIKDILNNKNIYENSVIEHMKNVIMELGTDYLVANKRINAKYLWDILNSMDATNYFTLCKCQLTDRMEYVYAWLPDKYTIQLGDSVWIKTKSKELNRLAIVTGLEQSLIHGTDVYVSEVILNGILYHDLRGVFILNGKLIKKVGLYDNAIRDFIELLDISLDKDSKRYGIPQCNTLKLTGDARERLLSKIFTVRSNALLVNELDFVMLDNNSILSRYIFGNHSIMKIDQNTILNLVPTTISGPIKYIVAFLYCLEEFLDSLLDKYHIIATENNLVFKYIKLHLVDNKVILQDLVAVKSNGENYLLDYCAIDMLPLKLIKYEETHDLVLSEDLVSLKEEHLSLKLVEEELFTNTKEYTFRNW